MFTYKINENLELLLPQPHHAEELLEMVRDNLDILKPWMPWATDTYSLENSQYFIRANLLRFAENGSFDSVILQEGKKIGTIGFHNLDLINRSAEVGYWLTKELHGKGIMTICAKALTDYLFDDFGLNRIQINCNVENLKSRAIPERLGFKLEGIHRQVELLNGKLGDWAIYAMLEQERETKNKRRQN